LTVVGTLVVAATVGGGAWLMHAGGMVPSTADPLVAFDARIGGESLDEDLPPAVAEDAERSLRAMLEHPRDEKVSLGARARLAVILGERGRWVEAAPLLAAADPDHTAFSRLSKCAYGPDAKACREAPPCDEATEATIAAHAGPWLAARVCVVASRRAGAAASETHALVARFSRVFHHSPGLLTQGAFLLAGALAAVALFRARRRRQPAILPPAPWPARDLYAAFVRCALWPMVGILLFSVVAVIARVPIEPTFAIVLYALGLWWMVRLVFRRWGLSWRDSLGWPGRAGVPAPEVALTLVAGIALDRLGALGIAIVAWLAGGRLRWSDLPMQVDATSRMRIVGTVIGWALLPALTEELAFRRVIFTTMRRRWAAGPAALASAVVFALPHGYSPVGLLVVFWTGLVTAWAFNRTGSLWPCIGVHAFRNVLAIWASLV
jgi:hypothetical protein